ncbi:hypothetical protein PFISCL1PPCAC_12018 [Pristionchus fissidentatus]|uniref:Uncharacterized protein n=1 Tax=Pristionchus fissidentatus TaxID=1538716 RepID=A0AAV5VQ81_9BILA|nr:hypothetical protein PFISCL1PPCAC_12018 [Pristionchus fissidentatus]
MSRSSSRLDPYSAQMREEQKAIINGLLGIIYDNYDTTRRMQTTVDSIHRMMIFIVVCVVLLLVVGVLAGCYFGCRRYQNERGVSSPLHQPRKSAPIEL